MHEGALARASALPSPSSPFPPIGEQFRRWAPAVPVYNILIGPLDSSSVTSLDSLFFHNNELQGGQPERLFWELWAFIIDFAEHLNTVIEVPKLAVFVRSLRDYPTVHTVKIWAKEYKVWTDLPLLGPALQEEFHKFNIKDPPSPELRDATILTKRLLNLNAFAAILTDEGILPCPIQAIWALRAALEDPIHPKSKNINLESQRLDYTIPNAVVWIRYARESLYGCRENFGLAATGGRLCKGEQGYSENRWMLWEEQFFKIAAGEHGTELTRLWALKAHEVMANQRNRRTADHGWRESPPSPTYVTSLRSKLKK